MPAGQCGDCLLSNGFQLFFRGLTHPFLPPGEGYKVRKFMANMSSGYSKIDESQCFAWLGPGFMLLTQGG
jgi:hypothetical protein